MTESAEEFRSDCIGNITMAECIEDMLEVGGSEKTSVARVNLATSSKEVMHILALKLGCQHIGDEDFNQRCSVESPQV
jgi:hypothetical protein